MKLRSLLAVLALMFGVAVPAFAGGSMGEAKSEPKTEEPTKKEPKAEKAKAPDFEAMLKDVDKVVTLNFNADDVKSFKDNWLLASKELKTDKKFSELKEKNVKEAFDYAITVEAYKKWAADKKIDHDAFARKGMRILLQHLKINMMPEIIKNGREQIENGRKMVEGFKDKMGEEKYKAAIAQMDDGTKMLDNMEAGFKLIPEPTEAEKKLLEADKDAIQVIMEADKDDDAAEVVEPKEGAKGN